MNPQTLSDRYRVRPIADGDFGAVLALLEGNPLYFFHCPPAPSRSSIAHDRAALPPGKRPADKLYLGFWDDALLVAVLDLVLGYPDDETALIGFFMMQASRQGTGEGSAIIQALLKTLFRSFRYVRLMAVTDNAQAQHFWKKNGFLPTGTVIEQERYTVSVLQRARPTVR